MKPMLASPPDEKHPVTFPKMASPKIDGIRCLVSEDGTAVSRSLKPIRNKFVQAIVGHTWARGLDGELVVGDPYAHDCMQVTSRGVMSSDGDPDFTFWVFDDYLHVGGFAWRLQNASARVISIGGRFRMVPHQLVRNQAELDEFEAQCLKSGYEGVMLRDPNGPYKYGRSSAKEGYLLKLKRFEDAEAVVVGVQEEMHNTNAATRDALGHTERSTHKAGMVGKGTLGALICKTPEGIEFGIGSGFTAAQRKELFGWRGAELVGKIAKYRHFAAGGVKDAPRFPVFIGFRDPEDMCPR
jgi:DNA ligase-1